MKSRRNQIMAVLLLVVTTISSVFLAPSAMAESDMSVMKRELLMNVLSGCYNAGHMSTYLDTGLGAKVPFKDLDSVFVNPTISNGASSYYEPTLSKNDAINIKGLDCKSATERLLGELPSDKDVKARQNYLTKLGYSEVSGRDPNVDYDVGCITIEYDANGQHYVAGQACWDSGSSSTDHEIFKVIVDRAANPLFYSELEVTVEMKGNYQNMDRSLMLNLKGSAECGKENLDSSFDFDRYKQKDEVEVYECDNLSDVKVSVFGMDFKDTAIYGYGGKYYTAYRFYDEEQKQNKGPEYGYSIMRRLNESETTGLYDFSNQEIYDLYIYYLKNIFDKDTIDPSTCTADKPTNAHNANTDTGKILTSAGWCDVHYSYTNDSQEEVTVFSEPTTDQYGRHYYYLDKKVKFSGLIEQLYEFTSFLEDSGNLDSISLLQVDADGNVPDTIDNLPPVDGEIDEGTPDPCYDNAHQLGWLLCPLVRNTGNAMKELYQNIIQDYLTIDSVLLTTGDSAGANQSGTYQAWSVFVGFANILTIVFLLVVIFSQVTGVGIDNYGIKKALPKIIIAAVLINLSFIICQLVADLSNIIGSSIEGLLTNIGDNLTRQTSLSGSYASGEAFRYILDALLITGGVSAVVGVVGAALSGGLPGLILPLLFGLLVALAAVLFFFVLLGLRKAVIVMLVAVSPIAFACYMLPNLKRQVFDRWFGLLKAMILVYPLCGFIIGGCNLASAILMSTGMEENFIFYFINMLLMVVPFFLLPSLIKKSMGAIANLTSMASRAVRGGINRGGARARKWNEDRPINQQRRTNRANRREQRWANRTNRRFRNGTDGRLTNMPFVGGAIKRRRDAMYGAAIQSAMKEQNAEAMRQELIANSKAALSGSAARAELDAQKAVGELKNYNDSNFVKGATFMNEQAIDDQLQRTARFAKKTAQEAYANKMRSQQHEETVNDLNYASSESLAAAKQANFDNAVKTAQGFWGSALQNGQFKDRAGNIIKAGDMESLGAGLSEAMNDLNTATDEGTRIQALARVQTLQSALMKDDKGYAKIREAYTQKQWGVNSAVKNAASRLLDSDGGKIKGKDRSLETAVRDVASKGVANGNYAGAGIEKITAETLSNCTQDYIQNAVARGEALQGQDYSSLKEEDQRFLDNLRALKTNYMSENNTHKQARVIEELNKIIVN